MTLLAEGGARPGILPVEAERDRAAAVAWRAQTQAVRSGVRLRTGCRDGTTSDRGDDPVGMMALTRSACVAWRRGERTHDGQSHPARPINTRRVAS
jgi:hypothetical protein